MKITRFSGVHYTPLSALLLYFFRRMYCSVPFCKSDRKRKLGISFHEFPANDDRRQAWLKAISRKDFVPNDKSSSSVVCSLHFADSDYTLGSTKLRRLKRDAVPSVFSGYPTYMHPQKPPKRRKLERKVQDFPSDKKKRHQVYQVAMPK